MAKENLQALKQSQAEKNRSLAEWRATRVHELDLPSGLTVVVRDVTMTDLLMTGKLPSSFMDMATDAAKSGQGAVDLKVMAQNGAEFRAMLDALAEIALVSPKIGNEAAFDTLTLDEMPTDDKMFIFNFVNREATQVKSFREGEVEPVAAV